MSTNPVPFKGYAIHDHTKWSEFQVIDIKPKQWEEDDVDIAITHCGICGSDIHTLTGGWGPAKGLPLVTGHEIIGTVTRVGSVAAQKAGIKVGDRVGIGGRIHSCGRCRACDSARENYCLEAIDTYNSLYPDGTLSQGGYSTAIRANHMFVFPIPKELKSEHAASMMCGGLTMYSPLVNNGCGPGKKVGIIGLGGLGHYGVLFAKALGTEVYVFSHSARKEQDAKKLGADHFVISEDKESMARLTGTLDLIISTVDVSEGFPLAEHLKLLFIYGTFINVGVPDTPLPQILPLDLILNGCRLGGSVLGSKKEAMEMMQLAVDKKIEPWIELYPMNKVKEAVEAMKAGKAKYRFVLEQDLV